MTTTTTTSAAATINFNGRALEVLQEYPLTAALNGIGLVAQHGVQGAKGALGLLQTFKSGQRRVVWITGKGRTENERP